MSANIYKQGGEILIASIIISDIFNYLDNYSLKTSKLANSNLISYVEDKWKQADDEKYNFYYGCIVTDRMANEYIRTNKYENMMRWLDMSNRHKLSQEQPNYIINYNNGQCCLKCGNEEKALDYFNLCYKENPEYIYTRASFCYEFFNKQLNKPRGNLKKYSDNIIRKTSMSTKDLLLFRRRKT
jgi:hypothetical protein